MPLNLCSGEKVGFREQFFIHRTGAKTATPVGKWLLREKTACVHHGADSGYSEMMHWRISKVPLFFFFFFDGGKAILRDAIWKIVQIKYDWEMPDVFTEYFL